jgi:hypothetical protein
MTTLSLFPLAGSPARAEVWGVTPRASLTTGYDHNVQLAVNGEQGQGGGAVSLGASVVRHGTTTDWSLDPQFLLVRYPEDPTLNRDDANVTGAVDTRFERGDWTNAVNYSHDTTVTSERGTSGLTESNLPHEHVSLTTMPSMRFAELWTAAVTALWSEDNYADWRASGLVDYSYATLGGQLTYAITERSTLGMDASLGRFYIPVARVTTDQYGANLRFDTAIDEMWHLSFGGGPLRVVSRDVSEPGIGLSAKLQRQSATRSFAINLSNDTIPDGRGTLSRHAQAMVSYSQNLSSRLATDLSAQWMRTRDALPDFGVEFEPVTLLNVSSALRWQAVPTVSISFLVSWTRQVEGAGTADAYRAALTMSWQGLEHGY